MYNARLLRKLVGSRNYSVCRRQDMSNNEAMSGPVASSIRKKLETGLNPQHCDIINESYMHNAPKGSESHFKVVVVSEKFDKQPLLKRHQMIYDLLQTEMEEDIHALSIIAKTPEQWAASDKTVAASPACRGGFGK
ncbi:bolA-like protein DDB_G0274169 isoform X2 [Odontomachus brunneus]|uniref:bolA-like protein DDB_G0274169 isoform X2 n=1 Tax=Odontomachus brunneus TaxID=486640 RepID=UPI0013F1D3CF|nr:bolA-like protein DDB_G0274169 isoform X2 [Odontomachus brunneus]